MITRMAKARINCVALIRNVSIYLQNEIQIINKGELINNVKNVINNVIQPNFVP